MCVAVHPVLWRERRFVQVAAVGSTALTRLDDHGQLLEALAVRTDEMDGQGPRAARGAAAAVCAHAAEGGPVEALADTLAVGEPDGLQGLMGRRAFLPSLEIEKKEKRIIRHIS